MNAEDEAQTRRGLESRVAECLLLLEPCVCVCVAPRNISLYAMNTTSQPPPTTDGGVVVGYVLLPFFIATVIGIAVAVVMYIRRKQRIDRLRHQLLPVYTYDPSEELNEAEQELLWREEDTKIVRGWARSYQQRRPLLAKDVHA